MCVSVRACLPAWVQRGRAGVCVCVRVRALLLWCFRGDRLIFVFMPSYLWPSRMTETHHNRPKSVVVKVLVFYPCSLLCIPFNITMVKIPHYNTVSLLTSLITLCICSLFCLVILGKQYTTPMVTVVCPVTSLHHMASLQSGSSDNCTPYAGIFSLIYTLLLLLFPFCLS